MSRSRGRSSETLRRSRWTAGAAGRFGGRTKRQAAAGAAAVSGTEPKATNRRPFGHPAKRHRHDCPPPAQHRPSNAAVHLFALSLFGASAFQSVRVSRQPHRSPMGNGPVFRQASFRAFALQGPAVPVERTGRRAWTVSSPRRKKAPPAASCAAGPFHRLRKNGEGGIRTRVRVTPKPVFETGSFNHSDTSPWRQGKPRPGTPNLTTAREPRQTALRRDARSGRHARRPGAVLQNSGSHSPKPAINLLW